MNQDVNAIKLTELSLLLKIVFTLFLVMVGMGYIVSVFNLYLTYHLTDGEPGLSVNDLQRAFSGQRNQSLLASKIDGGSMEQFLPVPGEKEKILSWLQDGARQEDFENIQPILEHRCLTCHSPGRFMWKRPLTSFEKVKEVAAADRGEPISLWARVAHTHLLSLAILFFCLSVIFSFCGVGQKMKAFFMPLPFLSLFLDFGARALIKYFPVFVYVMVAAGALMGVSMLVLTLGPLYDMWIRGRQVPSKS